MSGSNQNLLKESNILRDYTHANLTFGSSVYEKAPKLKFLFHVYFDINPEVSNVPNANYGLLVKTVKLPSFNMQVDTLNQYNRKRLIQTKIKYDPVDITFHDDTGTATGSPNAGGIIRSLWKAYYNYYYADGRNPEVVFNRIRGNTPQIDPGGEGGTLNSFTAETYNYRNQYDYSITGNANWGYIGDATLAGDQASISNGRKIPFFKNITVFGLSQHRYTAYTLINPVITSFSHDTYDYAQANGVMENKMTLEYETVAYNEGDIDGNDPSSIVTGFGIRANYDRERSPIARPGSNSLAESGAGMVEGGNMNSVTDPAQRQQAAQIANNYAKDVGTSTSQVAVTESAAVYQSNSTRNQFAQYPSANASGNGLVSSAPTAPSSPPAVGETSPAGAQNGPVYSNQYRSNI
jgi:hypothetical protein